MISEQPRALSLVERSSISAQAVLVLEQAVLMLGIKSRQDTLIIRGAPRVVPVREAQKRSMSIIVIAIASALVVIVPLFGVFGFPLYPVPVPVTVDELNTNPGFWVGRTVIVEGQIRFMLSIPEDKLKFLLVLRSEDGIIGIDFKNPGFSVYDQNVTVIGTVKRTLIYEAYYLEAYVIFKK